jgi:hypothetical protein
MHVVLKTFKAHIVQCIMTYILIRTPTSRGACNSHMLCIYCTQRMLVNAARWLRLNFSEAIYTDYQVAQALCYRWPCHTCVCCHRDMRQPWRSLLLLDVTPSAMWFLLRVGDSF